MIHGFNVGQEYRTALDGYMAEQPRDQAEIENFQFMLRQCSREELKEWYELYKGTVVQSLRRRRKDDDE